MDIFISFLGLMDATILAMLEVPILAFFLVGSLATAAIGIFILLKDAAAGRSSR